MLDHRQHLPQEQLDAHSRADGDDRVEHGHAIEIVLVLVGLEELRHSAAARGETPRRVRVRRDVRWGSSGWEARRRRAVGSSHGWPPWRAAST